MSDNNKSTKSRYRQQLMYLSKQKQQLEVRLNVLKKTIKELKNTNEKKVYKGIGNVFIYSKKEDVIKDNEDLIDTIKLKLKNLEKQESNIIDKINSLSKSSSDKKEDKDKTEGVA